MKRRQLLVDYVRSSVDPAFDPDEHELAPILDSVSLLQLITFIDQDLGVPLDLPSLSLDMFASIDSVLGVLDEYAPEEPAALPSSRSA